MLSLSRYYSEELVDEFHKKKTNPASSYCNLIFNVDAYLILNAFFNVGSLMIHQSIP